jgi:lipopolysaccharide/colanic/teichoic acid biosynthesis glycosyltransferase
MTIRSPARLAAKCETPFTRVEPLPVLRGANRLAVKRLADGVIALLLILLLTPLLLFVAALIKLESPGPVLFLQQRRGRGFRPFTIIKFRTMRHGIPDPRPHYETQRDDPRITRLGVLLRRTSIDELPQLANVLVGTMSLVGPRPLVEWESQEALQTHGKRFDLPPGITGLSQIEVRNAEAFSVRLDKDVEYVRRWSLLLDVLILARTPWHLLRCEKIYSAPQREVHRA